MIKRINEIILSFILSFKNYWKKPPEGRYMSYKEIASLATGGIGVRIITYCFAQLIISTGNSLLGNTIGIDPMPLQIIYMISLITAVPLTALRAKMIDNTKSMKGKYRPYILTMGLPTAVLGSLFLWMPYEHMSLFWKCAVVLGFNVAFQFFFSFFQDSYDSLINVLSPNSIERSDVLSIRYIVENLSPSIVGIIFPLLAKMITGEDTLYDIKIYRYLYPPMLFAGFLVSMIIYFNTTEKIVQPKSRNVQIKFTDAFRAVARNKYFWIISLAGWIGFLEVGFHKIMEWMYNYQGACTAGQYAVVTAIAGNASFWPNLVGPILIRKYGKKKILIWTNLMSVVFILAMLPVIHSSGKPYAIWVLLAVTFINQFITSLGHLLGPGVNADIRDYQHYISGERIDGMFSAVGLIGNAITMITGMALPAIYSKAGLNKDVAGMLGYDVNNVYEVLYNRSYFISICSVLIIASAVGAALNAIPYFFYDFTEIKQKAIVSVLKIRAAFEDYSKTGEVNDDYKEVCELIKISMVLSAKEIKPLRELRKTFKGNEFNKVKKENEEIEISRFILEELNKYNTEEGKTWLGEAQRIAEAGPDGFPKIKLSSKNKIKLMPSKTQIQANFRRDALVRNENIKAAEKAMQRYFKNGVSAFDESELERLYEKENAVIDEFTKLCAELKKAKEARDRKAVKELNEQLMWIKVEKKKAAKAVKERENLHALYYRAVKPYTDAVRVIEQAEAYTRIMAENFTV